MENRLDACENRWFRRITRIAHTCMITNETIRQSTDVQQDEKDAIKMAWEYVTDERRQTDQKCTPPVDVTREKIKRTTEQKMDGLY